MSYGSDGEGSESQFECGLLWVQVWEPCPFLIRIESDTGKVEGLARMRTNVGTGAGALPIFFVKIESYIWKVEKLARIWTEARERCPFLPGPRPTG